MGHFRNQKGFLQFHFELVTHQNQLQQDLPRFHFREIILKSLQILQPSTFRFHGLLMLAKGCTLLGMHSHRSGLRPQTSYQSPNQMNFFSLGSGYLARFLMSH